MHCAGRLLGNAIQRRRYASVFNQVFAFMVAFRLLRHLLLDSPMNYGTLRMIELIHDDPIRHMHKFLLH